MRAILLNRIILVLAFIGLFVAGVLSLEASTNAIVPCGPSGGCQTVANHPTSHIGDIPVAYFGVVGYLLLVGFSAVRALKTPHKARLLVTLGYAVSAIGTAASLWLQFISFFIIRATCLWCLSSAALMILIMILHAVLTLELDNHPEAPEDAGKGSLDTGLIAGLPIAVIIGLVVMNSTMNHAPGLTKFNVSQEVLSEVTFVPKNAHIYGQADAPITIVEFADILCPACQRKSPEVKDFVAAHAGKIRLVYRHYPIEKLHPMAMVTAAVSEIAAEKGLFWDFVIAQMTKGGAPASPDEILDTAKSVGLEEDYIRKRLSNDTDVVYDRISADLDTVHKLGVGSTPTFYILVGDKVMDQAGPSEIIPLLDSEKYKKLMKGETPLPTSDPATTPKG